MATGFTPAKGNRNSPHVKSKRKKEKEALTCKCRGLALQFGCLLAACRTRAGWRPPDSRHFGCLVSLSAGRMAAASSLYWPRAGHGLNADRRPRSRCFLPALDRRWRHSWTWRPWRLLSRELELELALEAR
jgi:hypothetical protein